MIRYNVDWMSRVKKLEKSKMTSWFGFSDWVNGDVPLKGGWCYLRNIFIERGRINKSVFEMLKLEILTRCEAAEYLLDIADKLTLCMKVEPRVVTHVPDWGMKISHSRRYSRNPTQRTLLSALEIPWIMWDIWVRE